ncbi:DNA directed RNA polymeras-like protein III subunit Rpc82 [Lophiotrema nucula]|uniref:DNA-directed RNA polymerase III subunit RPC3 n=1 Tax=Lophiotrema nucula TaxID=690887 RepID=A0A6A5ZGY7_9PLEO|nr:DNA directed RNA polymeras-like protein III subunit Rpc82 [Lophiotrema nucula]
MSYQQREPPILAKLCSLLVEETYGELAARVFSVLARHGRQTLAGLARESYLTGRQIKPGLVVLIQQHLVFHSALDPRVTYYEIDWQQSYALVRHGKILKMAEDRFGRKAANVLSNMLTFGHTRLADLKEAYFPSPEKPPSDSAEGHLNGTGIASAEVDSVNGSSGKINGNTDALTNGAAFVNGASAKLHTTADLAKKGKGKAAAEQGNDDVDMMDAEVVEEEGDPNKIQSVGDLYEIINRLGKAGWVIKVDPDQYLSPGDFHALVRQQAYDSIWTDEQAPTGTKDHALWDSRTREMKRQVRDEWYQPPKFDTRKRKPTDQDNDRSSKRQRLNGAFAPADCSMNGDTSPHINPVDDDLNLRVNFDKIGVALRTEQMTRFVEGRLGYTTSQVYRTMLCILEEHIPRCYEPWPDPPSDPKDVALNNHVDDKFLVSAREVAHKIGREFDLFDGLDPHEVVLVMGRSEVKQNHHIKPPLDPVSASLDERTRLVSCHIRLLANDPFHFATWHSRGGANAGGGRYCVEFDEIAKATIQLEIENTVAARKGRIGVKLVRALKKNGKLDERQACNVMMTTANDIREIVNEMTVQGFVQTQEIPRVDRREAKLSLHLIWYDRQRAREKLLHDTYKGMVRIVQRLSFEKEKIHELLRKAERSDVVGNETKYLRKEELDALKKWKEVEAMLLLQLFREDDLVSTLRDFIGPLVSV